MKSLAIALIALALGSGTALAGSCPMHMKKVDDAMASSKVSAAQMAEAKKLRAEGEAHHKAGKHADSMTALTKAEGILGVK
jgi:hypothetical protein